MSRLNDFFDIGGLSPVPDGVYVTGNMYGFNYNASAVNTVSVGSGLCYDSLNDTVLSATASQNVNIPTAINTIYNLFICNDGIVRTDTDINGATLLAGGVGKLRWIGFVLTDVNGNIVPFTIIGDTLLNTGQGFTFMSKNIPTVYTQADMSTVLPLSRCGMIKIGVTNAIDNTFLMLSEDGSTSREYEVLTGMTGLMLSREGSGVFKNGWYIKSLSTSNDGGDVCVREVILKR